MNNFEIQTELEWKDNGLHCSQGAFHSARNPEAEARRIVAQIRKELPEQSSLILIGLGSGFIISELLRENIDFILFEPVKGLIEILRQHNRLPEELHVRSSNQLQQTLESMHNNGRSVYIFVLPVYRRLFPEIIPAIDQLLVKHQKHDPLPGQSVDERTIKRFSKRWFRNFMIRANHCSEVRFLTGLRSEYKAMLFCGAGPTLLDDLRKLPLSPGEVLIIAADSAVSPVILSGIEPDIILSIDAGYGTGFHFSDVPAEINPRTSENIHVLNWMSGFRFQNSIFFRTNYPIEQILSFRPDGPLYNLPLFENPLRNVTGHAINLARLAGIKQIYAAGTNFRSIQGQSHSPSTGYCSYIRNKCHRTLNHETYMSRNFSYFPDGMQRQLYNYASPDIEWTDLSAISATPSPVSSTPYTGAFPGSVLPATDNRRQYSIDTLTVSSKEICNYFYRYGYLFEKEWPGLKKSFKKWKKRLEVRRGE